MMHSLLIQECMHCELDDDDVLHAVSSFLGGCAAQEVIKILTRQYTPLHTYCLYDALTSNTGVYAL
ncbi:nedd8-activating enzyme E1 regulatory subunit-like isoform X1 [Diaphorina citri]|uniref:Nedd8-activating enzyme E1 regulatory subunit-like isoform X1 n=1 Tax=Diaphorina citri TaxID=121845 RepID=A0A1S3DNE7_DIACI|nr:nedd8-activating enzyme E1 regulatory subunit-like isoform X2 [Diaphorina citri]XP_026687744.1 nedd8-activating enzyme E1 regulatory subunit-like isoform X1 [Diaphorina citri]